VHSVRDKHTLRGEDAKVFNVEPGTKIHGDPTEDFFFLFPKGKYKEGK